MDAAPAPSDIVALVREAPTPESRAALLGVDFARLVATARRLRVWAIVVCGVPAVAVLVPEVALATLHSPRGDYSAQIGIVGGVGLVLGLTLAALILSYLGGYLLRRVLGARRAAVVAVVLFSCLELLALYTAVRTAGHGPLFLGAVDGALIAPLLQVSGMTSLLVVLRTNHPRLVEVVRSQQAEPPWQTLLGGRVRWIIAALVVSVICSEAALLIFEHAPYDLAPVAALSIVTGVLAIAIGRRGSAWGWISVQALAAVVLVAVALSLWL